jgi:hypothetical protein
MRGGDRSILDENEEDKERARNLAMRHDLQGVGNEVLRADEKVVQVMRHKVGQLDSVKAMPYDQIEAMRQETEDKLKVLEEQYWGKKDLS